MVELWEYRKKALAHMYAIPKGIHDRWHERVEVNNWHGRHGAKTYLKKYGRNIGEAKLQHLAAKAEQMGDLEMALVFWEEAHFKAGHRYPGIAESEEGAQEVMAHMVAESEGKAPKVAKVDRTAQQEAKDAGFVETPGILTVSEPTLGLLGREHYIYNQRYWGQVQKNGMRLAVFGAKDQVWYQRSSGTLIGKPSDEIDAALKKVADEVGTFLLDGWLVYYDCLDNEHPTEDQAAHANAIEGWSKFEGEAVYVVARCLQWEDEDLRGVADDRPRLFAAAVIGGELIKAAPESFELLVTATTVEEKRDLVEAKRGETWTMWEAPYMKTKGQRYNGALVVAETKWTGGDE